MSEFETELYREELNKALEHTIGKEALAGTTVLVTGTTGEIGGFIVDTLMQFNADLLAGNNGLSPKGGIRIIACGRDVEKLQRRFAHWKQRGAGDVAEVLEFVRYDMLEGISDDFVKSDVDYVIHAAGNAYPSAFVNNPEETVKGNVLGTARLMDFAAKHGCKKFLYVSSGEVYSVDGALVSYIWNGRTAEDRCELVLKKEKEIGPRSAYPLSKVAAESVCLSAQASMKCVVARLCHTFGPGAKNSDDRAHAEFARKAAAGEEIVLNSAGTQLRSYNYIVDSAAGILSALLKGENHEAYDICSPGNTVTIRELAGLFAKAGGTKVVVKEPDEKQKALQSPISKQVLDSGKLEALGWSKAYELEDAVKNYVAILRGDLD